MTPQQMAKTDFGFMVEIIGFPKRIRKFYPTVLSELCNSLCEQAFDGCGVAPDADEEMFAAVVGMFGG